MEVSFNVGRCSAPDVPVAHGGAAAAESALAVVDPLQKRVTFNPRYEQMWAPMEGPIHPYNKDGLSRGMKNHALGVVEDSSISPFTFDEQYHTFQAFGYAADTSAPNGANLIGDPDKIKDNAGLTVFNIPQHELKKRKAEGRLERVQELEGGLDPSSDEWLAKSITSPWAGTRKGIQVEMTDEQKMYAEEHAKKKLAREAREAGIKPEVPDSTEFHGDEHVDYQGRSWVVPPADVKAANDRCFFPKRCIHTWVGHKGNVMTIQFFPKYGHLLLSGSSDHQVKIWDVHNHRKCVRTYKGHSATVRHVSFTNDGLKFLSVSYDTKIKLWDTETGKVISSFTTGKTPYVAKLHPDDDKQNVLMVAMKDKKVVQWDVDSGKITQEYDQHLDAVNTITFVDNNRRFITSSDDRSLRVWEFGIPVVIKYISEPHMHSMPSIAVHPNGKFFAAQSMDNQILVYDTKERFRLNKKRFHGHVTGLGCQVNFSPDGKYVISGDGSGRCWFWDWKTTKVLHKLHCFKRVCLGCEWHPLEQSKVATCGWEDGRNAGKDGVGIIKYWD
ncbi:hypothetical protein SELMODRAFT_444442 [Selaginella moellendorffii]|uniref:Pre-mRNA-processing factor 17 n=2 Tax=Selaginella moellendorffii TaxID=88036 RepID=D8SAL6_SELML|nr:hypothetical protein SELMODRAFT_444442 [Selaginella moellendorffii]